MIGEVDAQGEDAYAGRGYARSGRTRQRVGAGFEEASGESGKERARSRATARAPPPVREARMRS
jgi:hypothetical protein